LTTTYAAQAAIHNSLPVLQEIVSLLENDEDESVKNEVNKRRIRLGASGPEQLKKEVGSEIWGRSRVRLIFTDL
jgi:superkiller protein 3